MTPTPISPAALRGRRILVTRPRHQAPEFARALEALGAEVEAVAVMNLARVAPPAAVVEAVRRYARGEFDQVVFTSVNAVSLVVEAARQAGVALGSAPTRTVAIGPATAHALVAAGWRADRVPGVYVAEAVAEQMVGEGVRDQRIWLPRAAEARPLLADRLRAAGAKVEVLALYRTAAALGERGRLQGLLRGGALDAITFTSSSTVRHFDAMRRPLPWPQDVAAACIGPVTAGTARECGFPVDIIAAEHTGAGLARALARHFAAGAHPGAAVGGGGG